MENYCIDTWVFAFGRSRFFCFACKETSLDYECWKSKLGALCAMMRGWVGIALPFSFAVSRRRNPHWKRRNSQSCPSFWAGPSLFFFVSGQAGPSTRPVQPPFAQPPLLYGDTLELPPRWYHCVSRGPEEESLEATPFKEHQFGA